MLYNHLLNTFNRFKKRFEIFTKQYISDDFIYNFQSKYSTNRDLREYNSFPNACKNRED